MISEEKIIKMMRNLYHKKLHEVLGEADVVDSEGNVIIGKDLKVRHKATQYEYTVDDVLTDPGTGEIFVKLKLPEQPRFEPPEPEEEIIVGNRPISTKPELLDEDEYFSDTVSGAQPTSDDEDVFIIDKEEFEKEYEVK